MPEIIKILDLVSNSGKQAAKRVRESKRKLKVAENTDALQAEAASAPAAASLGNSLLALQQRVAELTAENNALRQQLAALQAEQAR